MFKCDKCGECCKNLDKSFLYAELDNGEGVCKYLVKNLCSIYEGRPLLCRIDESYEIFFKNSISHDKYYQLNYEFCEKLKKQLL
ncbi:YkgJ family cysteine cluster protein (plasmid) [Clostridioides difficile]|nr:YkgJ family cysteine cluster protein [Clostridioides difficile]